MLSFLKAPDGKEQKGTTVSFRIHPLRMSVELWRSETPSINTYVTRCVAVQEHVPVRANRTASLLRFNHTKAFFLMRVDRETWQSYNSYALNANVAVFLWIPQESTASTAMLWGQSTEGSLLEYIPYQLYQIKQLLLAKTIVTNVQLRSTQKTNL